MHASTGQVWLRGKGTVCADDAPQQGEGGNSGSDSEARGEAGPQAAAAVAAAAGEQLDEHFATGQPEEGSAVAADFAVPDSETDDTLLVPDRWDLLTCKYLVSQVPDSGWQCVIMHPVLAAACSEELE